ncbi:MAG: cytochrome c biogenesis protein CcsA [Candidatus Eisenbacteria bacterium]
MDIRSNPALRLLGSVKLTLVVLMILAVVTATATLIESAQGTAYAQALVYRTRWFEGLLILFAINMIVMFLLRWPFPRTQIGFMITHFSVIVILIGAGVTRFFGYEGVMTIREGSSSDFIYSREEHLTLGVGGSEASSEVNLYKPGTQNIRRSLTVGDETFQAAIKEYWPHMERTLQADPNGAPTLELTTVVEGAARSLILTPGTVENLGDTQVHFLGSAQIPATSEVAGRGVVRAKLGGESQDFAVPNELPAEFTLGGQRIRVTELNPDFKVGQAADPNSPMRNPALKLEVVTPEGRTFSQQHFALHAGFVMGDSLSGSAHDLALTYEWSRNLYLRIDDQGSVTGTAEFPVQVGASGAGHMGGGAQPVDAGTPFSLADGATLQASGFGFQLDKAWKAASWGRGASMNQNAPAGALVEIADSQGNRVEELIPVENGPQDLQIGDRTVQVAIGPIRIPVGYQVHLDDFVLVTYPGSNNPASFESHVRLSDPAHGIEGKPVRIYMNHPLTYRGFKHFQSSYDQDRKGTVLSVNHDPGKWPTYVGYILMTLGFMITLSRGLLWNRNPQPMTQRIQKPATRKAAQSVGSVALGLVLLGAPAMAADAQAQGHDHSGTPTPFLSADTVDEARHLIVQDYQGRMKPLDTYAREMVVKVTKKSHFEGWDPVELYLSWVAQPRYWFNYPLLKVRNPGLKNILGIDSSVSYVSAASVFDAQGNYRIQSEVELAHRTPDRERSKAQRKLLAFDDRLNLFLLSIQGQTFKIFPVPDHANDSWLGVDVFGSLPAAQRDQFQAPYAQLTEGMAHGDAAAVATAVPALEQLQRQFGEKVMPSDSKVRSEIWLNQFNPFMRVMALYGLALVVMGIAYVWGLAKRKDPHYPPRHPLFATGMVVYTIAVLFHLFGYILRWTASSHAPLSNGYESLIFISLATAIAGLWYEYRDRRGSSAGLSALLVLVILGVAMLPTFDPAISPIVPVLASYWLIIHVTVITASYSLLGLAATMGMTILILHLFKRPGADRVRRAVLEMTTLLWRVLVAGLAMLSVGTLLGGVWANESWGRYWGWDPKETWALVTILVYATVVHFRYIPALNRPWVLAAASFVAISSVIMTYLGVNYLLTGLHSYGSGEATGMPGWVYYTGAFMALLVIASYVAEKRHDWTGPRQKQERKSTGIHVPA